MVSFAIRFTNQDYDFQTRRVPQPGLKLELVAQTVPLMTPKSSFQTKRVTHPGPKLLQVPQAVPLITPKSGHSKHRLT